MRFYYDVTGISRVSKVPEIERKMLRKKTYKGTVIKAVKEDIAKLDAYKLPSEYLIYDRLPILSNGKIDAVSLKADAGSKIKNRK